MRNPRGYAVLTTPEAATVIFDRFSCEEVCAGVIERDTFTCCHCNRIIHVKPMAPMDEFGSMCRNCMKMVCPTCADGSCVPFEKKLEMSERRDMALKSYGF